MFKAFKPKKNVFLKLLDDQATLTHEGLNILVSYMEDQTKELARELTLKEKEADEIRRILIDELNKTFVTPFDREDIFSLSARD